MKSSQFSQQHFVKKIVDTLRHVWIWSGVEASKCCRYRKMLKRSWTCKKLLHTGFDTAENGTTTVCVRARVRKTLGPPSLHRQLHMQLHRQLFTDCLRFRFRGWSQPCVGPKPVERRVRRWLASKAASRACFLFRFLRAAARMCPRW